MRVVALFVCPTALRKNPEERPTVLEMVHHPWVELYRMRRSMRQINLVAAAPTAATSTFTTSQVAAATAAAGAAIGAASVSASCPSLTNLSQLLHTSPEAAGHGICSNGRAAADSSNEQQGPMSAAAAAAAALNAVKKNIKQTVANKMMAGAQALQSKPAEPSKLGTKEDLHLQLSSASSPCLLGAPKAPNSLLKAAVAGNLAASTGPAAPPAPATPATPAALTPPGPLLKGGSLKLDADARTFLFVSAFGTNAAGAINTGSRAPAGQLVSGGLASNGPLTAAAAKQQQAAQQGPAGKTGAGSFRAAH